MDYFSCQASLPYMKLLKGVMTVRTATTKEQLSQATKSRRKIFRTDGLRSKRLAEVDTSLMFSTTSKVKQGPSLPVDALNAVAAHGGAGEL